ncbi:hydantoinase/oxoprolinase family protein [Bacillus sp. Marseille-P3661]|uniref:hydantoinase/oxoprolinase family protein n=1 Tax=Bacillus sp. Marseille-P3661 TaxID=1936234 RepID=UPI000C837BD1|nr:hydantoinase/oxoprolinase family protein [Bacillus sp. Marseille-P3661]
MTWAVGIDTGGTFTDLAAVHKETGEIYTTKVPSNSNNPALAIVNALEIFVEERNIKFNDIDFFAHGTTVATNAVIENRGAKTGLLITEGMRAVYDTRGGTKPIGSDIIDPFYKKPPTLVSQELTKEIKERIMFDGAVLESLNEVSVIKAVQELKEKDVKSIAVSYLFSFINPEHELQTEQLIKELYPECRVSLSSKVHPVIREYIRLSTTVLDAFVGPVMESYFQDLDKKIKKLGIQTNHIYIMQSNGGLMRINIAVNYPNETLLSGPAAGVVYGTSLGKMINLSNIVTFDMGGTSADISVIYENQYSETRRGKIAGQDIGTPMIQINALGAGGGTIAYIGKDGLLKVGPRSAGAFPGPASYCRGGTEPTVTDANIVLGYLDPANFAGGRMNADKGLAKQALTNVGKSLNMDAVETAIGVNTIVNTQMAVGLRTTMIEQGVDPRQFALVAFGGSGPLHAAALAKEVGIPKVVVPLYPGLTCAVGLLCTDVKHIYIKSFIKPIYQINISELKTEFDILIHQAIEEVKAEGFNDNEIELIQQIDIRYPQQGYELTVDIPSIEEHNFHELLKNIFHEKHERIYGLSAKGEEPETVNIRLFVKGKVPKLDLKPIKLRGLGSNALKGYRNVYFDSVQDFINTPVYDRQFLGVGSCIKGPAIVEQADSTTIILPGMNAEIEYYGNMIINCSPLQEIEGTDIKKSEGVW